MSESVLASPPTPSLGATPSAEAVPAPPPLYSAGAIVALSITAAALSGLVVIAALPEHFKRWPFTEDLSLEALPRCLPPTAAACALLLAPALASRIATNAWSLFTRAFFMSLWQSAVLGFFLILASRLAALEFSAGLKACCVLFSASFAAFVLAERTPRLYPGIVFLWGFVLPVSVYLFGEVGAFNAAGAAEQTALNNMRAWVLGISPATAAHGAVRGKLLGGEAYAWGPALLLFAGCLILALLVAALTRNKKFPAALKSLH